MDLRSYTTLPLAAALMAVAIPFSDAQTSLNPGGKLSVAADWTNGIPTPANPGTITVDGIFDSTLGTTSWGRDTQVAHTAGNLVGTGTNGFNPTRGVTWNMSGGSITGRFVTANASTFNMSGGLITIRNDAGTKAIQAANDGIWNLSGSFTIDATFASTDPFIQPFTGPGTGSTYNFLPGWTGSWTHGTMSGDEWRTYVTTHPEFKLSGTPITTAIFDASFVLTNGGMTLSMAVAAPSIFQLIITPGSGSPGNYDFVWDSQDGKYYKLVSSSDLSTPIADWPTWEGHLNIVGSAPTNSLANVSGGGGGKRFFAVVETDIPEP